MTPEEAIGELLKALPRCCNCQTATATIIDAFRWPLCERCWKAVPGSNLEQPSVDMRQAVQNANRLLRISLANSLAKTPSYHEIPPPPSNPPSGMTVDLEELEARNRKLRRKIHHMKEIRRTSSRRIAVWFFIVGAIVAITISTLIRYW